MGDTGACLEVTGNEPVERRERPMQREAKG